MKIKIVNYMMKYTHIYFKSLNKLKNLILNMVFNSNLRLRKINQLKQQFETVFYKKLKF